MKAKDLNIIQQNPPFAVVTSLPYKSGGGVNSRAAEGRQQGREEGDDFGIHSFSHYNCAILLVFVAVTTMMDLDSRVYENVVISDNDVRNIVLSYLVHNCFKETAEALLVGTGVQQQSVDFLNDMEKRKAIFHYVLEGNALGAIELTEQVAPNLLEQNEDLHFDLLGLHFVDLVCAKKCTEALEFAQAKLTSFGKIQKSIEKLEDFMALLAYEEPEKSPMFHLIGPEYRHSIADNLNQAILAQANLPAYSSMERLIQQAILVRQCLNQELGKDGPPAFSLQAFLKS
ncbi:hypothetical protein HPP92_015340 [Vanilla planifolia]|uniref:CTLH domain-containing protein n=1 Tax=Vanilla planifolia TaxID=51239 RepID=A0A835QN64_VANPL|nr:hypothetical protein HPP92_015340 [Vanilla planifolia]